MTSDLYSFGNLWRQYRACRRNQRNSLNQLRFEVDLEAHLIDLRGELRAHTYRPGRSICFVTDGPKPREVLAADFRDRVVHHVLVSRLEAVPEPQFIHDSFACCKGKGELAASGRLMLFLRRVTANGQRRAWALKLDIASFFPSIGKQTLYEIIARRVQRLIRRSGPGTLVFCQVGRFVEFDGPQRERAAGALRLVRVKMGRGGHAFSVGFPVSRRAAYLSRAVRHGYVRTGRPEKG